MMVGGNSTGYVLSTFSTKASMIFFLNRIKKKMSGFNWPAFHLLVVVPEFTLQIALFPHNWLETTCSP